MKELFKHQEDAIQFIIGRRGCGAVYHEMGLGKTRTAIEIFSRLRKDHPLLKMLVVAPLSLLNAAWGEDIEKFSDFKFCNLRESPWIMEDDGRPFILNDDIFAVNYEFLISKVKLAALVKMLKKSGSWILVIDESSRMKNHRSITAKTILKIRDLFPYRIVMSGTPFPNSLSECWAQMEFLKPNLLGSSFYWFRNTFFHLENKYTHKIQNGSFMTRSQASEMFKRGWGYAITEINRKKLMEIISPLCHWAKKSECLDLPDEIDEVRKVKMAPEQEKAYKDMKTHLVAEIQGQEIAAQVALTKLMLLREITSGFCYNSLHEGKDICEEKK